MSGQGQAPTTPKTRDLVIQAMYEWQDGWRFCDEKFAEAKWAKKFGIYPGDLVYSSDCACQLTVDMSSPNFGGGCGCICHKKTAELADIILKKLSAGATAESPTQTNQQQSLNREE